LTEAVAENAAYIENETLALNLGAVPADWATAEDEFEGETDNVGLKKAL